ncbi:MAG: hypothetical protein KatS3mg077_2202 [Candidatus Binatia bacterium]|nr:MAG: hypothetical protein KatS3mg077_2202 [Candidatus Binatia bacterium]
MLQCSGPSLAFVVVVVVMRAIVALPVYADSPRPGSSATQAPVRLDDIHVRATSDQPAVPVQTVPQQDLARETVQSTSSHSVSRALEELPDLYIRQNESFRLGATTIRMQGAEPNKVAVLIDGRRMLGGADGVVDLRDLPVELIERIEVRRGIAGTFTDSEAMGGSVNIVSRLPGDTPEWSAKMAGGSFDRVFGSLYHGGRWRTLRYAVAYEHDEFALAQQFGAISRQFEGARSDAKQVRDNVFVRAVAQPAVDHQVLGTVHFLPVREGPLSRRVNWTADLGFSGNLRHFGKLSIGGGRYRFDRQNDLPGFEEDVGFEQWFGDATYALPPLLIADTQNSVTAGWRLRRPSIELNPLRAARTDDFPGFTRTVRGRTWLYSPFLQYDWTNLSTVSAVLGISFDLHSRFGLAPNPRAVLTWRPGDQFRLSMAAGRGFRAPDLLQLFDVDLNNVVAGSDRPTGYAILGDRNLRPEFDYALNIEADWVPTGGLVFGAAGFHHAFRNLIDVVLRCANSRQCSPGFSHPFPTLAGQVFQYANVASAQTAGFEVSSQVLLHELVRPWPHAWEATFRMAYGYLYSRNGSDRPGETGNELPFRPPHRFIPSVLVRWPAQELRIKFWATYEDRTFTDLLNTPDQIAGAHWLANARAEWGIGAWAERGLPATLGTVLKGTSLFFEAYNIADREFGVPGPLTRLAGRRSLLAGVHVQQ